MKGFTEPVNYEPGQQTTLQKTSKSEQLKDAILNSLSAQIAVLNARGVIQTVNEAWIEFAKENSQSATTDLRFIGVNYLEVCGGSNGPYSEEAPAAFNGIHAVLQGEIASFTLEYPCHSPEKKRWFLMKVNPLPDFEGAVVSHTDISERRAIDEMKDEFISIASHELKTPITSLKGIVHILQLSFEKKMKGEVGKLLRTMDIQLDKLSKIIGDVLVVNTMPGKKLHLINEKFNFKSLVRETVQNVRNISPLHFLSINENESVSYFGDRFRLEQVITNLLTNAVKYSPQSNQVFINSIVKEGSILFSVQDFGMGVADENKQKIFEKFYRAKTSSLFGGLGLGLFISCEIIKGHGGKLWMESKIGKGSTFYFSLPLNV
ncbi:MAG: ATP-binding protein [Ginsengibacter sp.]